MRRRGLQALIAAAAAVAAISAAAVMAGRGPESGTSPAQAAVRTTTPGGPPARAASPAVSPSASPSSTPAWTDLTGLSVRQMAGQRVVYGYIGLEPPSRLFWLIRHGEAGGVVFSRGNISSSAQIANVVRRLKIANANSGNPVRLPLLLMLDQEGGYVRRLPGAPVPSEKQIGSAAQPVRAARAAGAAAGRNLRGVGMNMDLAPVLDVYRQAGNFIDRYGRSYSSDPRTVAALGAAFVGSLQARKVVATAKHFPGLGAATTLQDTDMVPVTLTVSRSALRRVDELPYEAAIASGVRAIMLSWAVYPALDPGRPAGISATIVQSELRGRLGFTGVTITDSLGAGALKPYGTLRNRTMLAARAGMDIMLGGGRTAGQCTDALVSGYTRGTLDRAAFREAVARVLALRATLAD